jgi:crossover junction endodeoxyribonuclease RuvC
MIILGIDPGISGGSAIISTETYRKPIVEEAMRMPSYIENKKKLVDADALFKWWMEWPIDVAVIEWVHAMPKQGTVSTFAFGRSTGAVEAVAQLTAKRVIWVTPQRWKKHYALLKKDKGASLKLAQQKFGSTFTWHKLVEDGIAEAALMALWYVDNLK